MYRRLARFNKKTPTSVKTPYIIFNPHTQQPCLASPSGLIYITTIDPGIKNCCIRCSAYDPNTQRSKTLTQSLINFTHFSLVPSTSNNGMYGIETSYYSAIFVTLGPFIPYFINSHYIGVESQLPINYDLVRMSQHILTYLMYVVRDKGNRPYIMELAPQLKSRMLGAPPKMTKPQLKKWAREKGIELLKNAGEHDVAYHLEVSKGDDHGDTICYEQVIILILYGRSTYIPPPVHIFPSYPTEGDISAVLKTFVYEPPKTWDQTLSLPVPSQIPNEEKPAESQSQKSRIRIVSEVSTIQSVPKSRLHVTTSASNIAPEKIEPTQIDQLKAEVVVISGGIPTSRKFKS